MSEARPGTVAEEAARLLRAVQEAAATWQPQGGAGDTGPTTCQLCPVCQGIAAVQRLQPETVQHLADTAAALAAALADVVGGRPPEGGEQDGPVRQPRERDDVQRIHITD